MAVSKLTKNQMKAIAEAAVAARTAEDAQALLSLIHQAVGEHWRPVGDREDNYAPIEASSDPKLAFVERITNQIDALIELRAQQHFNGDMEAAAATMSSPRSAAQILFNVPPEGLSALEETRQELAELAQVDFVESGSPTKPTLVCRDFGIGLSPTHIPSTILSIQGGNKRAKPFMMGLYGWGGAHTLSFSAYTIIVSRRHEAMRGDNDVDGIGVTLVKSILEPGMRTPTYCYAVDVENQVLSLEPASLPTFGNGVHIAHIEYDLTNNGGLINQFNYLSAVLFEPVLPIFLGSHRDVDSSPGRRTIIGTGARLRSLADEKKKKKRKTGAADKRVIHNLSTTAELGEGMGSIRVHIWVLEQEDKKAKEDLVNGFVTADSAVTVTLNGQRQEVEKRDWIKRGCRLPHLSKRMIIQVVADDLTQESKIKAFASTRERLRGPVKDLILSKVLQVIEEDDAIASLEERLREKSLQQTAEKASKKDLDKLARAIGKLGGRTKEIDEDELEEGRGKDGSGRGGSPRDTNDDHLPAEPTRLTFDRHVITIEAGGRNKRVMLDLDTKNGYLPDHDEDLTITVEGPSGETKAVWPGLRADLAGGMAQWLLSATDDAEVGEYKLTVALVVGDKELSDRIAITVVPSRDPNRQLNQARRVVKRKRQVPAGPSVSWVRKGTEAYDEHQFTTRTVGTVVNSGGKVDILLNLDFDVLQKVLSNRAYTPAVVDARKSAYMVPTALGLYRIDMIEESCGVDDDAAFSQMRQVVADCVLLATDPAGILGEDEDDD